MGTALQIWDWHVCAALGAVACGGVCAIDQKAVRAADSAVRDTRGNRRPLFMLALGLLGAALLTLAREVWIGLNDFDHHA